tara:strand:- start:634 stop:1050 length:417 start_codon:yes stop_codon:yes gene_type:complete
MATIKKIDYKGNDFNDLHKFEIELEVNGEKVIGNIYKKQNDPYFKVDDEVEYSINDKGTLKLNKPGQQPFQSSAKIKYNLDSEEVRIARSVALKCANEYAIHKNYSEAKLFQLARQMTAFIEKNDITCCLENNTDCCE